MLPRLLVAAALASALTACSASTAAVTSPAAELPATLAGGVPTAPVSSPRGAPARLAVVPAAGTVTRAVGPFDDRLTLTGTALRSGSVRTAVSVTSDVSEVSEVIVLEAQSDFYDSAGALLGSVRATHEDDHGAGEPHAAVEEIELVMAAAPAWAARVHSAVLSVPVLVNE